MARPPARESCREGPFVFELNSFVLEWCAAEGIRCNCLLLEPQTNGSTRTASDRNHCEEEEGRSVDHHPRLDVPGACHRLARRHGFDLHVRGHVQHQRAGQRRAADEEASGRSLRACVRSLPSPRRRPRRRSRPSLPDTRPEDHAHIHHVHYGFLISGRADGGASLRADPTGNKSLDIYLVDVEGGNSTSSCRPPANRCSSTRERQAAAARDADRIMAAVKDAGLRQIDHLITHAGSA